MKERKIVLFGAALLALALVLAGGAVFLCSLGGEQQEPLQSAAVQPESSAVQPEQQPERASASNAPPEVVDTSYQISMVFSGDINLDPNMAIMVYAAQQPNGVADCIDAELRKAMVEADLCCINNEFTFSRRGSPMEGKAWTFRADPDNVSVLTDLMGVDLVTLANNHVYDYGYDAFTDTLAALDGAGIARVGAGENLEEASAPVYFDLQGVTVAVVNANRSEKNVMTPGATEDSPGVFRCYDPTAFAEKLAEAKEKADFVICCVHWGTEYSYELEDVQRETARTYIDAGADVIIGTHSHCLQGIEYYNGKPVFYSLGNFWFNSKTLETGLLKLELSGDSAEAEPKLTCTFLPAIQEGCVTRYAASQEDREAVFGLLNRISINASVGEDGTVSQAAEDGT